MPTIGLSTSVSPSKSMSLKWSSASRLRSRFTPPTRHFQGSTSSSRLEKGGARLPLRLCFSGGLAGLVVGGIVLGLSAHYLNRAVSSLAVNLSHSTTAGLLILGSSAVISMWYTPLLANPLAFLSLSASTVAISALAVLIEEGLTRRTGLGMDVGGPRAMADDLRH